MSIKVGDKDLFPYLGDYRPVNIYKGEHKVAGWKWTEQSGKELLFENTYNDFVEVEVDGKSYQEGVPTPDYPIEIHSLNDFDVVSQKSEGGTIDGIEVGGRNLLKDGLTSAGVSISKQSDGSYKITNPSKSSWGRAVSHPIVLEPNQEYTFSMEVLSRTGRYAGMALRGDYSKNLLRISTTKGKVSATYKNTTTSSQTVNIWIQLYYSDTDYNILIDNASIHIRGLQVEKGNKATPWTPAPEDITENDNHSLIDKINLSLSEPLRSVGDVHDRLFRDSDGLWKVERNVGERVLKGTTRWSTDGFRYQGYNYAYFRPANFKTNGVVRSNILPYGIFTDNTRETLGRTSVIVFNLRDSRSGVSSSDSGSQRANKIRDYLFSIEGAMVSYELATPTTETLDQNLQDKLNNLRSFQGSNYVYTVINDKTDVISETLKPTLHARLKVKDI